MLVNKIYNKKSHNETLNLLHSKNFRKGHLSVFSVKIKLILLYCTKEDYRIIDKKTILYDIYFSFFAYHFS